MCLGEGTDERVEDEPTPVASAIQYQGTSCRCCNVYANYLQDHTHRSHEVRTVDDSPAVKERYGIPPEFRSCHTVKLDTYAVGGHMPVEVIENLLKDAPHVDRIALPGIPGGSPGMGGQKIEQLIVYEIPSPGDLKVNNEM